MKLLGLPNRGNKEKVVYTMTLVEDGGQCRVVPAKTHRGNRSCGPHPAFLYVIGLMSMLIVISTLSTTVCKKGRCCRMFTDQGVLPSRMRDIVADPIKGNVYFHKRIADKENFDKYAPYLSDMALKYPSLKYNVVFMVNDNFEKITFFDLYKKDDRFVSDQEFLKKASDFTIKHPNVDITTLPLSLCPSKLAKRLHNKENHKVQQFIAGAEAVWEHGGIALDLDTFNERFNLKLKLDPRIEEIFKKLNDGLSFSRPELEKLKDEDPFVVFDVFTIFSSLRNKMFNTTKTATNVAAPECDCHDCLPLVRKHRNKREVAAEPIIDYEPFVDNKSKVTEIARNKTNGTDNNTVDQMHIDIMTLDHDSKDAKNIELNKPKQVEEGIILFNYDLVQEENNFHFISSLLGIPRPQKFNDVSAGPPAPKPEPFFEHDESPDELLVLDSEGLFISANKPCHKFLETMLFPMHKFPWDKFSWDRALNDGTPNTVIENTLHARCDHSFNMEPMCRHLYFL